MKNVWEKDCNAIQRKKDLIWNQWSEKLRFIWVYIEIVGQNVWTDVKTERKLWAYNSWHCLR